MQAVLQQLFDDFDTAKASIEVPFVAPTRRLWASARIKDFSTKLKQHANNSENRCISAPMTFFERAIYKGPSNKGELNGDKYLNSILQTLTEFHDGREQFMLRDEQLGIVAHMTAALLPLLYGEHLETNRKRLLDRLMLDEIKELVFILAGRRAGKTTAMGAFFAAVMIVFPGITIAVVANVMRNAIRIKDAVVAFLNMHPRGKLMLVHRPGFPHVVNNTEILTIYGDTETDVRDLRVYPAHGDRRNKEEIKKKKCECEREREKKGMASSFSQNFIKVGSMNLDWTCRATSVRSAPSMEYHIKASLERLAFPDIFGFSEVSMKTWVKSFEKSSRYVGKLVVGSYERDGYFYIIWNKETCSHLRTISSGLKNRFIAMFLHHIILDVRILFVTVHMPRKLKHWQEEAKRIRTLVCEERGPEDLVVIAGDFNADPKTVALAFASLGLQCAIHLSPFAKTTAAGNSIDNILSSTGFGMPEVLIDDCYRNFSHFPIAATVPCVATSRALL